MDRIEETNVDGSTVPGKTCVKIRNAYKRYSQSAIILKGLNMTVQEGTIYGLLGPSGCGKSTLLSCIVGRMKLDSGTIQTSINKRSGIGFMPQTLSLFADLTIYENLILYGHIFSMTKEKALNRAHELISFLELPSGDRFISTLSGGQQRRVSMAITFLHDPQLLILDEPTVGMDVQLVQNIWGRLAEMVDTGKTIIITTHYIQEAHKAHRVGMMRNGVLLTEEDPQQLILKYNCNNLEETFLILSQRQEDNRQNRKAIQYPGKTEPVKTRFRDDKRHILSSDKLKGVLYKDVMRLKRNYVYLLMVFISPVIQICIFNWVFGHQPEDLRVAVVNEEISLKNCSISSSLGCFLDEKPDTFLSCLFVDILRSKSYKIEEYANTTDAVNAVKTNAAWGALHFPKNYTKSTIQMARHNYNASLKDFYGSRVEAWMDMSGEYIGTFVKDDVQRTGIEHLRIAYRNCGLNPSLGNAFPIQYEEALNVIGTEKTVTLASVTPAALCMFSFGLALFAAIITSSDEKFSGTIDRMLVAGVTVKEYMFSFTLVQLFMHMLRIPMMMLIMYWVFDNPHKGNLIIVGALLFIIGFLGLLIGVATSMAFQNVTVVTLAGNTIGMFTSFASGLLWPLEGQHPILKAMNLASPLTWVIKSIQAITVRDQPITNFDVVTGFGATTVWSGIFVVLIYLCMKYKPNMWIINE